LHQPKDIQQQQLIKQLNLLNLQKANSAEKVVEEQASTCELNMHLVKRRKK